MTKKKSKLTPADEKFIAKFLADKLDYSTEIMIRTNPFSGAKVELDPVSAVCYDFAITLYKAMSHGDDKILKEIHPSLKMSNVVSNYDRARFIVLKMNPEAYSSLLD